MRSIKWHKLDAPHQKGEPLQILQGLSYCLNNRSLGGILLERPKALQERIFARLFEQAEVARFTPQERNEYVASKKEYWDAYSIASTSYNKGLAKGLAEGETKGIAKGIAKGEAKGRAEAKAEARQEKLESARKLKARGFSADDIVEIIGITPEELDTL